MDVTREQLSAAFARPSVRIAIDRLSARDGDDYTEGHVRYPQVAADMIVAAIRELGPTVPGEPGTVVDAHICCEHIEDDPELSAMAAVLRLMEAETLDAYAVVRALYPLDGPALPRVLRWFLARFPVDPPF